MPWRPLPQVAFAVCIYPFRASSPADLPLELGDDIYIIEQGGKDGSWYRGYLVAPPSLLAGLTSTKGQTLQARVFSGIFPRNCVEVREVLGDTNAHASKSQDRTSDLRGRTSLWGEAEDNKANGTLVSPGESRTSASGSRSRQTSSKRDGQDPTSSNSRNSSRSTPIDALDFPMPPTPSATRDSKAQKPAAPVPLLKVGDETPTSAEEPLVDEISSCLREWHSTKLHEFLLSRRYDVLDKLSSLVQRLDTARRQLLHGVLTAHELERLRETTVWDLVHGNKLLSGEVIVRSPSEKGRVMTADDSAVEITQLQAMMSLLDEKPGQQQPDTKSLYYLLVDVRDFAGDVNQPMTLAMYLCSKTPGDKPRPVSEVYTVELLGRDTDSSARSSTDMKTLFVDLNNNDIGEGAGFDTSLFLVFKLMTNKPMKPAALHSMRSLSIRDSAQNANPAIPQHVSNSVGGRRSLLWSSQRGHKDSDQAMRTSEYRPTTSASSRSRLTKLQEKPPRLPESSNDQNLVKRTVGVGALEIGSVLRGGLEIDHRISMWAPGPSSQSQDEPEEQWDDVIKELAQSPVGQYKKSHPVHRFHIFAKAFSNLDAGALVKNTPTMLHEVHQTRKIGFSGAPTKARSDIYLTLLEPSLPRHGFLSHPRLGSVPPGQDSEMANLQLTLEVRRSSGDRIEGCIYPSGNSLGHTAWRTTAVEREEGWDSTIRLAIDPEDVPGSHVVMSLADGVGFPFALSWMPLWTQEAFVPDGDHVLTLYKYDEYTSSVISGKGAYLALPPWSAKKKDESVTGPLAALHLSTYLCSTRYSQDPNLLGLLKWRDHHGSDLQNLLKRFVFVPELEIVKLLNEVFDALFAVLDEYSGSEEYEDLIFNNLVIVLGIVHDRRFDLVPLVDHYIGAQFSWPGAASCLIRGYMRLLADPVNPEASRSLRATFKVGGQILKFIVSARYHQKEKEAGIGITSRGPAFVQELQKVFKALEALMRNPAPTLVGTKTLVVQHFHLWLPVLSEVITPREILQMAISFIDSCASAQGKLSLYRLVLILHYTQLDLFNTTALRRALAVETVRWLDPNWGFVDTVTEQWKEQVRLCCSTVASQLNYLGPETSHYILKLVDAYTTIQLAPRSRKNSLSLLFPSSYPFPTTTTAAQADVDEALVEITALVAACFNAPNSLTLDPSAIDVSEFLFNTLQVYKSVLACEAFPSSWLSVHIFHHKSAIRTLENLFSILVEFYLPHPDNGNEFNSDIWRTFLDTLLKLCSSDALAMETFPEQKRRTVWKIAGDVREVGADLLRRSWEALGWETNPEEIKRYGLKRMGGFQVTYVPSMVAPIVALCMSVHAGLRKVAIEVLQSMIVSEWTLNEDLSAIQAEMIDCLDYLFKCRGVNDTLLQKPFTGELLDLFEPLARTPDDALHRAVKELISTIGELLDLLIAVHSADGAGEAFRIMNTLHLMEFLRDVPKENIYVRYVHQLARVQSEAGNLTEAGQALRLHAELYDWDPSAMVEPLEDPKFPTQTSFERREQIYFLMIKHYEEGSSWDNALGAYQELAAQYEHNIFDFAKLARTQRAMATIYESIAKGDRQSPRYFRVVYKGLGFPTGLRDKQFVFEGTPTDRLPTFTDRMQQQHPAAKVLQPGGEEDVEGQYLQIYPVNVQKDLMHPIYQRSRVPQPIREHILLAQPKNFTTTSRRQASRDVRSNDQVVQKTVYTTQDAFPTILRRSEIVQTTKVTLTPIQAAIERTTRKTQELVALEKRVTDGLDSNLALLTDALMVSVDTASENSVSRYRELLQRSRSWGGDEGRDGEDPTKKFQPILFRMRWR
ncbi:C2 domain in Dock180 and Zizimin proteins-domain-containing protein [Cryomyces antarcticus]